MIDLLDKINNLFIKQLISEYRNLENEFKNMKILYHDGSTIMYNDIFV